jgi:DNA-binding MltR family transcriptional regulator
MPSFKKTDRSHEYQTLGQHPELNVELVNSSDRVAALIGASIIDLHLERLLASFFIEDEKEVRPLLSGKDPNAALGTLSSRNRAAYCLGLISKVEFEDINTIRNIRNAFAHQLFDCSFQTPEVRSACEALRLFEQIAKPPEGFTTRVKFTFAVTVLEATLGARTKLVQRRTNAFEFTRARGA